MFADFVIKLRSYLNGNEEYFLSVQHNSRRDRDIEGFFCSTHRDFGDTVALREDFFRNPRYFVAEHECDIFSARDFFVIDGMRMLFNGNQKHFFFFQAGEKFLNFFSALPHHYFFRPQRGLGDFFVCSPEAVNWRRRVAR